MHIYIYDDYVNTKKYDTVLAKVETRITDLGLNGKIIRLGAMKNIFDAVENELKNEAKTIVAVGNDKTVNKVINAIINAEIKSDLEIKTPLGVIPLGEKDNLIAKAFGIATAEDACDILSARMVEKLDLGRANNNFFLSQAKITSHGTILEINKNYSIEITEPGIIEIINLPTADNLLKNISPNPQDGIFELCVKTRPGKKLFKLNPATNQSFFSLKKLTVINKKSPLILDNAIEINTPAEITAVKQKINIIVGKDRKF